MIETVFVIEGFFCPGAGFRSALWGRRWPWRAMPEGWLVLNGPGTGCARDIP